jgi:hypothetical protein
MPAIAHSTRDISATSQLVLITRVSDRFQLSHSSYLIYPVPAHSLPLGSVHTSHTSKSSP